MIPCAWKKVCPRCGQRCPCLSVGDFKACPNCYIAEFGEWQTDDICMHGNDANHVPCEKCWAPKKRTRTANPTNQRSARGESK